MRPFSQRWLNAPRTSFVMSPLFINIEVSSLTCGRKSINCAWFGSENLRLEAIGHREVTDSKQMRPRLCSVNATKHVSNLDSPPTDELYRLATVSACTLSRRRPQDSTHLTSSTGNLVRRKNERRSPKVDNPTRSAHSGVRVSRGTDAKDRHCLEQLQEHR